MRSATWTERRQQWASFLSSASSAMVSSPSSSKNSWTYPQMAPQQGWWLPPRLTEVQVEISFPKQCSLRKKCDQHWPMTLMKERHITKTREKHTTSFLFSFCWLKVDKCLIHSYVNSRHVYLTYTFVSSLVLFTTCFSERGFLKLLFILRKTWRR